MRSFTSILLIITLITFSNAQHEDALEHHYSEVEWNIEFDEMYEFNTLAFSNHTNPWYNDKFYFVGHISDFYGFITCGGPTFYLFENW